MEITGSIKGAKKTAKTLRTIGGRVRKANKPMFAKIGSRIIGEVRSSITAQDLFLKKPHKGRVRGQLFNSIKIIRNTGNQVTVGPGKKGFFGRYLHHGAGYAKTSTGDRKYGLRIKKTPWAYISDSLVDWAVVEIADYAAGEDLP